MAQQIYELSEYYKNINDEDKRLTHERTSYIEFLTTAKYLDKVLMPNSKILDACAGTGVYAFYLAESEKNLEITVGDVIEHNLNQIRERQKIKPVLKEIYCGSILNLPQFEDESFDAVLNLGSLYHMTDENDRIQAVKESLRVLKQGGIYCAAYLCRYANIAKYHELMKESDKFWMFEKIFERGYSDDNSLFYTSSPEETIRLMASFGLEKIYNVATDGVKFMMKDTLNSLDDETYERWLDLHFKMCEVESLLGYSEHCLYIGRKT